MKILIGIIGLAIVIVLGYQYTKFIVEIAKEIGEDNAKKEMREELARAKASADSYKKMYDRQRKMYEMKCKDYERKCKQYEAKCLVYDMLCEDYTETATKLDSIKTIELIDNYEYDEDNCTMKNNHRIVIEKAIEELKAENLINNYLTVELTEEEDLNCYHRSRLNNGQLIDRKIYMNYDFTHEGFEFMIDYVDSRYGLDISDPDSLAMFTFLHEFGHYIDSTLEHDEDYEDVNNELKEELDMIEDYEEAQIAYREIPEEAFADKWAVDFMKAHFPELALA